MSLKELNVTVDPTMGMGSNDISWWDLDINPQFPRDLAFDTTAFGLQNEQSLSSTSSDFGFNQHFSPTFNSPNLSFDTPAFEFQQFSRPSSASTDFTSVVSTGNNDPSFSFPSTAAPAVANAPQPPSQFIGGSPFMQFQPTLAPAPAFPNTGAPSNASSPTVVPSNAPQHIPAASNASSQPIATPISPQHIPATTNASPQPTTTSVSLSNSTQPAAAPGDASSPPPAQNTLSSQHAAAIAQPVHTGAKNGTAPSSPLSDSRPSLLAGNPETSALSSVSGTSVSDSSSVSLNQADGRRSGRNPVPSKRHEQMNEIDGRGNKALASPHIEKENIPSATPDWTIASHDHLLKSDLGEEWTACVRAWFELEQELGYGSQAGAKVCPFLSLQGGTSDLFCVIGSTTARSISSTGVGKLDI